ncbi:unnamed protein product [Dovyalis caffra]|uniref:Uncharacterized protein n=1 Tax=Dovyalis caffra TaxID=77055 RepID=A0AAV1RE88_9ROSI|nr:unnamed protein product [Dovyalis caffra]
MTSKTQVEGRQQKRRKKLATWRLETKDSKHYQSVDHRSSRLKTMNSEKPYSNYKKVARLVSVECWQCIVDLETMTKAKEHEPTS